MPSWNVSCAVHANYVNKTRDMSLRVIKTVRGNETVEKGVTHVVCSLSAFNNLLLRYNISCTEEYLCCRTLRIHKASLRNGWRSVNEGGYDANLIKARLADHIYAD